MKNSCPQWDSYLVIGLSQISSFFTHCRSERAKRRAIKADIYRAPKGNHILPE